MQQRIATYSGAATLPDVLERILDKGVVIAGDISILIGSVELLTIRIRLLVASVDKAQEIGIDWWKTDPLLSPRARRLEDENRRLQERLDQLEGHGPPGPAPASSPSTKEESSTRPSRPRGNNGP
ncbi:MAG: gas vesicle protein [Chloroflexi bacterium]|nr:gas vesicle protein [Chloroflexota bacterium]